MRKRIWVGIGMAGVIAANAQAFDPSVTIYKKRFAADDPAHQVEEALAQSSKPELLTTKNLDCIKAGNCSSVNSSQAGAIESALTAVGGADKAREKLQAARKNWRYFRFSEADPVVGGLALDAGHSAQTVKLDVVNYNLWFGGNLKQPFQLLVSGEVADQAESVTEVEQQNSDKLVDPESGIALRFPFLFIYQPADDGFCDFTGSTVGRCTVGGDLTFNSKELKGLTGTNETAYGYAARIGASFIFPVLNQAGSEADEDNQGYLAIAVRETYARTNLSDPAKLFTPVLDASGTPVKFDESILATEAEIRWNIRDRFSINAKWIIPGNNDEYLDDSFTLSFEKQFAGP